MLTHGSSPSCFQAQRDAVALAVEAEHADVQLVADVDDLGRVPHALPRHVGDVQQAVDAAEVHERAVVGEVLDHALDDRAFLQALEHLLALGAELALDHCAPADHDVVALAVDLDDLELEFLALEVGRVAHRAHVDQRTGQERADFLDVDREAALDLAADAAGDGAVRLVGLLELIPDERALGLLAREHGLAEAVLDAVERDLDLVADLDADLAVVLAELLDRDDALGLEARIDDDDVVLHVDDDADDDGAGAQLGQGLLTALEQFCE